MPLAALMLALKQLHGRLKTFPLNILFLRQIAAVITSVWVSAPCVVKISLSYLYWLVHKLTMALQVFLKKLQYITYWELFMNSNLVFEDLGECKAEGRFFAR